jgi:hypothetical protein
MRPAWNPMGRELFYVSPLDPAGKRRMIAIESESRASESALASPRVSHTFHTPFGAL